MRPESSAEGGSRAQARIGARRARLGYLGLVGKERGTFAGLATVLACGVALICAAPAGAEITSVLGGQVDCETQGDGTRFCGGANALAETFDGQLIDVNVAFPPEPASGPDGPYPLVMHFHGYGGSKLSLEQLRRWTDQGYAAFSMSDRGFGPCGAKPPPARCLDGGWVRLMDTRYEVRDAQLFAGTLVDDGVVDPARIAATGGSYGGGLSMALAALRNRVMLEDGTLVPWTSPEGTPISLAAAAPEIPWTDLAYSLMPNGRTLDYVADAPYRGRVGVKKETFVDGLYASGEVTGYYAPPLADEDADLRTWFTRINAGEPYDGDPLVADILDEVTMHHSSYYIDHSIAPAPLLISNGWTDDIFPADEAIRFYNRTRSQYPGADVSLFFLDYGHQRGQSKSADVALLRQRQDEFFAHHLAGGPAPDPAERVTTLTQTCPEAAPSGGPYAAPTWAGIAPGEVRGQFPAGQTISPTVPQDGPRGQAYDPITTDDACATAPGSDQPGAASYRLEPAPAGGYTLMGSPTVIADFALQSPTSQVAARLLDVAPSGDATLVARASWRPATGGTTREVFQLHPNGWHFAEGHVAKLELLPVDAPYGRPSDGQGPVDVANLELRLPVLESPGAAGGVVLEPAPKLVPDGYELAPEQAASGGGSEPLARCRGRGATIVAKGKRAVGTSGDDVIVGGRRADDLRGRAGDDLICARGGRDRVRGGRGDDELWDGGGRDDVRGGPGRDRVNGKPERSRTRHL